MGGVDLYYLAANMLSGTPKPTFPTAVSKSQARETPSLVRRTAKIALVLTSQVGCWRTR